MPTGTITRVFEMRGFGYITPDEGDRDLLMRALGSNADSANAASPLCEGARVRFEVEDSDAGLRAVSVAPLH